MKEAGLLKGERMGKKNHTVVECRTYRLPPEFPMLLLNGDAWRISEVPADRLHFHNCLEIGLCETEGGTVRTPQGDLLVAPGDVTFIGANVLHTTFSHPGTAGKWSYLYTDAEALLAPFFPAVALENGTALSDMLLSDCALLPADRLPQMAQLVRQVIWEMQERRPQSQTVIRGLMLAFTARMLDRCGGEAHRPAQPPRHSPLVIAPALDYIRANYRRDFSVELLARECGLSLSHFRRVFSAVMGVSPLGYLIQIRLQKACGLLCTTGKSVLEISGESGFMSVSGFNRHFLKAFGETPSQWRKGRSFTQNNAVIRRSGWQRPPEE